MTTSDILPRRIVAFRWGVRNRWNPAFPPRLRL